VSSPGVAVANCRPLEFQQRGVGRDTDVLVRDDVLDRDTAVLDVAPRPRQRVQLCRQPLAESGFRHTGVEPLLVGLDAFVSGQNGRLDHNRRRDRPSREHAVVATRRQRDVVDRHSQCRFVFAGLLDPDAALGIAKRALGPRPRQRGGGRHVTLVSRRLSETLASSQVDPQTQSVSERRRVVEDRSSSRVCRLDDGIGRGCLARIDDRFPNRRLGRCSRLIDGDCDLAVSRRPPGLDRCRKRRAADEEEHSEQREGNPGTVVHHSDHVLTTIRTSPVETARAASVGDWNRWRTS